MKSSIISSAAFAGAASARIVGLAAPAVIAPNDLISVTLITENYIQSVKDISAAFALSPQVYSGGYIGTQYLGSYYLGPDKSNVLNNITIQVTTPSTLDNVKYLNGIVTSLYGVSNGAATYEYAVPVTPGAQTSTQLNSNTGGINGNCFAAPSSKRSDCFPTSTISSIQSSIQYANALIADISLGNNNTGRQNLGELNGFLGDVFAAVDVQGKGKAGCGDLNNSGWPPLSVADSKARAIGIARDVQSGLMALEEDVQGCDEGGAFGVVCQVLRLAGELGGYYG